MDQETLIFNPESDDELNDTPELEILGTEEDENERIFDLTNELHLLVNEYYGEDGITREEWDDIFASTSEEVRQGLNIRSVAELREFVGLYVRLSSSELQKLTQSFIEDENELGRFFFYDRYRELSPEDLGELLYIVFDRTDYRSNYIYFILPLYDQSPRVQDVLLASLRTSDNRWIGGPLDAFLNWPFYKDYPWASNIILEAARYGTSESINDALSIHDFPEEIVAQLQEIIRSKQARESILYSQIDRELQSATTDSERLRVLEGINSDPSLAFVDRIEDEWLIDAFNCQPAVFGIRYVDTLTDRDLTNFKFSIARNLFFTDKAVNRENVVMELMRILEMRNLYNSIPLFNRRNIVLGAHLEVHRYDSGALMELHGDEYIFGRDALVNQIRLDGGNLSEVIRAANNSVSELEQAKENILEQIIETQPPMTFVFDGHGGPDAIYLSDGVVDSNGQIASENATRITVQELFAAYKVRQERYPLEQLSPETVDIFLNLGCYSANFIREFYRLCENNDCPKPIFGGQAEFGQVAYSEYSSIYGDNFFDLIFADGTATIGDFFMNDSLNSGSNLSLYLPDINQNTMQLSENDSGSYEYAA